MNMKKWMAVALAAVVTMGALAGCSKQDNYDAREYAADYDTGYYEVNQELADAVSYSANGKRAASGATTTQPLPQNRKWVITMNLSAETGDLDGALASLLARVNELEGYVESQNVSGGSAGSGRHRFANLTFRIPADQVDSFVEEVAGLTNLVSSSRSVQDITLSYSDTEGRVKALAVSYTHLTLPTKA